MGYVALAECRPIERAVWGAPRQLTAEDQRAFEEVRDGPVLAAPHLARAKALNQVLEAERLAIEGLGAPFGAESRQISEHGLRFREAFAPGAFAASIAEARRLGWEIFADWRHEGAPLASTRRGDLRVWEAWEGLMFEMSGAFLSSERMAAVRAGEIGVSVKFKALEADTVPGNPARRTVRVASLVSLALTSSPAYPQTWVRFRPGALRL